jgi:hypothetical protein
LFRARQNWFDEQAPRERSLPPAPPARKSVVDGWEHNVECIRKVSSTVSISCAELIQHHLEDEPPVRAVIIAATPPATRASKQRRRRKALKFGHP